MKHRYSSHWEDQEGKKRGLIVTVAKFDFTILTEEMADQIKTLRTGPNSTLQTLLQITRGSPAVVLSSLLWVLLFHYIPLPPLPCLPKGGSHACGPSAPAGQTQKINYTPTPPGKGKETSQLISLPRAARTQYVHAFFIQIFGECLLCAKDCA